MISLLVTHVQDADYPPAVGWGFSLAGILLIVFVAALIVVTTVLLTSMRRRSRRAATQHLDVLKKALEHPQLDAETRARLLATMVEQQTRRPLGFLTRSSFWLSACFVVGWLLMIINGVGALLTELQVLRSFKLEPLLVMGVSGLALVTLPIALREFLYRASQASEAR